MQQISHGGPPHGILLAVVVGIVVLVPFLLGYSGEALTEFIAELISPFGLLLLPIILLLTIQFLSSDCGSVLSSLFYTGEPDFQLASPEGDTMQQISHGGPPHGILLAVVVGIVVLVPFLLGYSGEALTEFIAELISPFGLLFLTIQFLSSDCGSVLSSLFYTGEPDSIHRVSGSPVGVALILVLFLFLLYNRVSIFGGDDDSSD